MRATETTPVFAGSAKAMTGHRRVWFLAIFASCSTVRISLAMVDAFAYTQGRCMPRWRCRAYQAGTSEEAAAPGSTSSTSALSRAR